MEEIPPSTPPRRLPRFQRAGPEALPFRIQERNLAAWLWIYDNRFLPLDWLQLVLGGSAQQLTRRAQRWFHAGFVDRIRTGLNGWVYAIANQGADEVCVRFDRERGHIDWNKKNGELKDAYFRAHTLRTARFAVTLALGLREKALRQAEEQVFRRWPRYEQSRVMEEALALLRRQNHSARWDKQTFVDKATTLGLENVVALDQVATGLIPQLCVPSLERVHRLIPRVRLKAQGPDVPLFYTDEKGKERKILPDRPVTLIDGNEELDFFVETDRSTMTNHDFYLTLRAYWLFWKQEREKTRQGLPAQDRFRVLTTCRSKDRYENLRRLSRAVDDRQTASEMFLFCPEERYDPRRPVSIWEPIWQMPKDDRTQHLLE
jgi:hypothetical protein